MSSDRRQKRKEMRLVQNEAAWIQKALFALSKAENAFENLADFRGDTAEAYAFEFDDRSHTVEEIEEALEARLDVLKGQLRERRQALR